MQIQVTDEHLKKHFHFFKELNNFLSIEVQETISSFYFMLNITLDLDIRKVSGQRSTQSLKMVSSLQTDDSEMRNHLIIKREATDVQSQIGMQGIENTA